jgi:hypothetical protein
VSDGACLSLSHTLNSLYSLLCLQVAPHTFAVPMDMHQDALAMGDLVPFVPPRAVMPAVPTVGGGANGGWGAQLMPPPPPQVAPLLPCSIQFLPPYTTNKQVSGH